jgi:hypothetical protein
MIDMVCRFYRRSDAIISLSSYTSFEIGFLTTHEMNILRLCFPKASAAFL